MITISIVLLCITFFVSIITFIAGFGLSTIMMPLLVLFMPATQALLFVSILDLVMTVWRSVLAWRYVSWNLVVSFGIPCAVAAAVGSMIFQFIDVIFFNRLLGAATIIFVVSSFIKTNLRLPAQKTTLMVGGVVYGLSAGALGVGGGIRAAVLHAFDLSPLTFIAANGFTAFFASLVRIPSYFMQGFSLPLLLWGTLFVCVFISFVGAKIGAWLVGYISAQHFKLIISLCLLAVGLKLLIVPL